MVRLNSTVQNSKFLALKDLIKCTYGVGQTISSSQCILYYELGSKPYQLKVTNQRITTTHLSK